MPRIIASGLRAAFLALALLSPHVLAGDIDAADKAYARKNFAQAIKLYRKAAVQGDAVAQFKLGTMYTKAQGGPQNFREAASWFLQSATKGYAPAQNSLGVRYEKGQGVAQNYAQAAALYRQAADQRLGLAQDNLADLYARGLGVAQNDIDAWLWSSLASANGEKGAARKRIAIEHRLSPAQLAEARFRLGYAHTKGQGTGMDAKRAVQLYMQSAAQGNVHGQYQLAIAYEGGLGVAQDYRQAIAWYEKAAQQGDVRAQSTLGYMFDVGQGVAVDAARARGWYEKAALQGDAFAQYNLGSLHGMGRGVEQSDLQAYVWFCIAEANRNNNAVKGVAEARRQVEVHMTAEQIAEGQRIVGEWLKENVR